MVLFYIYPPFIPPFARGTRCGGAPLQKGDKGWGSRLCLMGKVWGRFVSIPLSFAALTVPTLQKGNISTLLPPFLKGGGAAFRRDGGFLLY